MNAKQIITLLYKDESLPYNVLHNQTNQSQIVMTQGLIQTNPYRKCVDQDVPNAEAQARAEERNEKLLIWIGVYHRRCAHQVKAFAS